MPSSVHTAANSAIAAARMALMQGDIDQAFLLIKPLVLAPGCVQLSCELRSVADAVIEAQSRAIAQKGKGMEYEAA